METENAKPSNGRSNIFQYVLTALLIVASFYIGMLWTKVNFLEKNGGTVAGAKTTADTNPTAPAQQGNTAAVKVTMDMIKKLVNDKGNIVFGDANRKLIFVEFSDPSCPYCHIAAGKDPELNAQVGDRFKLTTSGGTYLAPVPEMKKLVDQGKASYVWVYTMGHGSGELATQAFYCANDQGKFWQVHDLIMSNKGYNLLNDTVKNDVKNAGQLVDFLKSVVNADQLSSCLTSGKYASKVTADNALAQSFGVQGTPNFFVNETNFNGAYPFTDMQPAVTTALK